MKVYLFDTDNGLFLGEDFCEPHEVAVAEGMTTVPPPRKQPGEVAVYDPATGEWRQVAVAAINGGEHG